MCGIAGVFSFKNDAESFLPKLQQAVECLRLRGPDDNGIYLHRKLAFGHTRLSVIDTSQSASQPMTDASGRYTIIFNGEFFNFKEHRNFVLKKGIKLKSESDTEVLLYLYILEGEKCLQRINGFFAFAIYDKEEESLFIARDRMGIKPLLIFHDDEKLFFASEMKAMMALGIPKEIDNASLYTYLQLNYIPSPHTIFRNVKKLEAGSFLKIRNSKFEFQSYYTIPNSSPEILSQSASLSYQQQQEKLFALMDESVQRRLIADVPLGCFLSGGIDSSVITALASRHTKHLNTFSIGFKDEPMFDETHYAKLVADKCKTNHTVFSLSNDDLFKNLFSVLDYIDEPFADSSSLNVYILSMHTRKHATVALSGDGADELFGGYNKHAAELRMRARGVKGSLLALVNPVLKVLPQSRNGKLANKFRQLYKFSEGKKLSAKERYWRWAGYLSEGDAEKMLIENNYPKEEYSKRKTDILKFIRETGNLNDVLYTDMHLVLQSDMLTKVDMMSMANSLEVRVPFLDYTVVDFAFSLPLSSKIDKHARKKIVRDAFRKLLPEELYTRPKQGFEVPLLKWFRNELKSLITDDLLADKFIEEQNIFSVDEIKLLKKKLFSKNPGDSAATVWSLIVFQYWWKKYLQN